MGITIYIFSGPAVNGIVGIPHLIKFLVGVPFVQVKGAALFDVLNYFRLSQLEASPTPEGLQPCLPSVYLPPT